MLSSKVESAYLSLLMNWSVGPTCVGGMMQRNVKGEDRRQDETGQDGSRLIKTEQDGTRRNKTKQDLLSQITASLIGVSAAPPNESTPILF